VISYELQSFIRVRQMVKQSIAVDDIEDLLISNTGYVSFIQVDPSNFDIGHTGKLLLQKRDILRPTVARHYPAVTIQEERRVVSNTCADLKY